MDYSQSLSLLLTKPKWLPGSGGVLRGILGAGGLRCSDLGPPSLLSFPGVSVPKRQRRGQKQAQRTLESA